MAKAVVCALRDSGFQNGMIVARNKNAGSSLAQQYGYIWKTELNQESPQMIINVTPIGMAGAKEANELSFKPQFIESAQIVFDVVAIPSNTPLIQYATQFGKQTISGADVIVIQALEQFVLYTGVRPSQELIKKAAIFAHT
jgi:shikimate dehydrogenase